MCLQIRSASTLLLAMLVGSTALAAGNDVRQVTGDASLSALGEDTDGNSFNDIANSDGLNTGYVWGGGPLNRSDGLAVNDNGGRSATAGIEGRAEVGHLFARSRIESQTSPPKPELTVAGGTAYATAEWGDRLVLQTAAGVYGTPVRLRITVDLSAGGGVTRPPDPDDRVLPNTNFLSHYFALPQIGAVSHQCTDFNSCSESWSYELNLVTVQAYTLTSYLQVNATSNPPSYFRPTGAESFGGGSAFAQGTSRMFIEVLTPGAWYMLDSGLQLNPVPEAPTWAMLAGGLILLRRLRRPGRH